MAISLDACRCDAKTKVLIIAILYTVRIELCSNQAHFVYNSYSYGIFSAGVSNELCLLSICVIIRIT